MVEHLLAHAQAGNAAAFAELTEPYRRELQVHCYRILGTVTDAEDLVQETLLSAWRAVGEFRGHASVRTWLYRIATNRCLNALRDRERRPQAALPTYPGSAPSQPSRIAEVTWLEPYPDLLLDRIENRLLEPEARIESWENISLAFITLVQTLPPQQRAVLVLRDVLGFRGTEVAGMLNITEDAVASGLKRARATLAGRTAPSPTRRPPAPGSNAEQRIVKAFVGAFENGDVPTLLRLLTTDAWFTMPPLPLEYQGHDAIGMFLAHAVFQGGARSFRLVPTTRANGQPAFGRYVCDRYSRVAHPHGLMVLSLDAEKVTQITGFLDTSLLARFGLPRTLPD